MLLNLRARISELLRRQINGENDESENCKDLWVKVRRSPSYDDTQSLTQNIQRLSGCIDKAERDLNARRVGVWKQKMQDEKQAYKWLKGPMAIPVLDIFTAGTHFDENGCECDGDASGATDVASNHHQALVVLRNHWDKVWKRIRPSARSIVEACLGTEAFTRWKEKGHNKLEWEPITAEQVMDTAKTMAGTSAGLDGWSGTEIQSPAECCTRARSFLQQMRNTSHDTFMFCAPSPGAHTERG